MFWYCAPSLWRNEVNLVLNGHEWTTYERFTLRPRENYHECQVSANVSSESRTGHGMISGIALDSSSVTVTDSQLLKGLHSARWAPPNDLNRFIHHLSELMDSPTFPSWLRVTNLLLIGAPLWAFLAERS